MIKFKVLRPFFLEKETIWRIIACHIVGAAFLLIGLTNWRPTIASPLPVQLDRQSILPFTSAAPKWHFQCVDCSVDAFY